MNLTIFNNNDFGEIRTAVIGENPYFMLSDVCRILEINNPSQAKTRLRQDGVITNEIGVQTGTKADGTPATQTISATFIDESNLYKLAFTSRKAEAERFTDWVTREVLPTIRKTGGYVNNDELFINTYLPFADDSTKALFKTTLHTINEQNKLIAEQKQQISTMKPKAEFFDTVANSKTAIEMGEVAKVLDCGMGRNKLFEFLRKHKVLMSNNIPMQIYIDRGYFRVIEQKYTKPNGETVISIKTLVYQKGVNYIKKLIEKKG